MVAWHTVRASLMKLVIGHDVQLADAAGDHVWDAQNVQLGGTLHSDVNTACGSGAVGSLGLSWAPSLALGGTLPVQPC